MGERFREFLSTEKRSIYLALLLCLGAVLMLVGNSGVGKTGASVDATLEERTEQLCSAVEGVGECDVMITYGEGGEVYAVAVLCDGAERASVRRSITELASSLFGIGTNRISVLKKSK